jgi:hypothetical protein
MHKFDHVPKPLMCHGGICDEDSYCEYHSQLQARQYAYLRGMPLGAITGRLSERDNQDLRDAGRGHLCAP